MNTLRYPYVFPILVFLIAFLLRIPLLYTEFERTPDTIEYINVAENLAIGNGYIKTVKDHFFDDRPVIDSGSLMRPPLTPFVYSLLLKVKNDYYILQGFNLLLGSINVVLFYTLLATFIKSKKAFIAALLLSLNPNLIIENRFILSEQIFYCTVLLFFIAYFRFSERKAKYMLLGILSALSYLTRVEGILLLFILGIIHRKKLLYMGITIFSFLLTSLPNFIINYQVSGNPFHSFYFYHFRVLHYIEAADYFNSSFPPIFEFLRNNFSAVIRLIGENILYNFLNLVSFRFLGILSFFFILIFYKRTRKILKKSYPVHVFSILLFLVATVTWSVFFQPERHVALVYILFVFLLFVFISKTVHKKWFYFAVLIMICIYIVFDIHQLLWIRQSVGSIEKRRNLPIHSWIREHTSKKMIIASRFGLQTYLFTDRPSIQIPFKEPHGNHQNDDINLFIKTYRINYFHVPETDALIAYLDIYGKLIMKEGTNRLYCVSKCK